MFKEAVYHQPSPPYLYGLDEERIAVRLRAKKGDLKQCVLFYGDRYASNDPVPLKRASMTKVASDLHFDYFEVELAVAFKRICYLFWLHDGKDSTYYFGHQFASSLPVNRNVYFILPYLRREEIYQPAPWASEAVIYQIFPDSFATGPQENVVAPKTIRNQTGGESQARCGGDLPGIIANLPYLADLGINCLYLTPIFTALSYHKYDTADYFTIDPCFGDLETFKEMVRKAHELGIKVILDGVFNHCGPHFFAFQDVLEKGEKSAYRNVMLVSGSSEIRPLRMLCIPPAKTEYGRSEVKHLRYILLRAILMVGAWMRPTKLTTIFECFRRAVKAVKPEAILVGEIWGRALLLGTI